MNGQKDLDLGDSCGVNDTAGGGPHLAHAAGQQKRCARTETTQTNAVSPVAKAAPQAQSDSRGSAKAYFAAGPTCSATTPRAASCSGVGSGQLLSEGRTRRGKHMGWETVVGLQADAVLDGRSDGSPTAAQFDSLGGVLLFFVQHQSVPTAHSQTFTQPDARTSSQPAGWGRQTCRPAPAAGGAAQPAQVPLRVQNRRWLRPVRPPPHPRTAGPTGAASRRRLPPVIGGGQEGGSMMRGMTRGKGSKDSWHAEQGRMQIGPSAAAEHTVQAGRCPKQVQDHKKPPWNLPFASARPGAASRRQAVPTPPSITTHLQQQSTLQPTFCVSMTRRSEQAMGSAAPLSSATGRQLARVRQASKAAVAPTRGEVSRGKARGRKTSSCRQRERGGGWAQICAGKPPWCHRPTAYTVAAAGSVR